MCWTTTKATPLSVEIRSKKVSIGSSPPAEAPIPTIGSSSPEKGGSGGAALRADARGAGGFRELFFFVFSFFIL